MTFAEIVEIIKTGFLTSIWPVVSHYVVTVSPVLLAFGLGKIFWDNWVRYVQLKQFLSLKYTVLELKLPKETFRSPLAMETVLHAIHNTADGSHVAQYWKGETRPWYSLEIASFEGQVKFFLWTEDRRKSNLMSAFYSQYPGVEISEREDYAKSVQYDPKIWKVWAAEFEFTRKPKNPRDDEKDKKPSMSDVYPIKTYVDYNLEKDPKEEFKVDPMVHMLEWFGSLRPNEQTWFQFIIRAHKDDQKVPGKFFKRADLYKESVDREVNRILIRDPKTKVAGELNPETGYAKLPTLSKGEQGVVEAIERKAAKLAFDVCIRTLYIAKKEVFDTPFGIGGCISGMKQFNSDTLNGFRPNGKKWIVQFDSPWQDYRGMMRDYYSRAAIKAYRRRSAFYPPYKTKTLVLNTEELATIYHLPGSVASTASLDRVQSKKAAAPSNLPI